MLVHRLAAFTKDGKGGNPAGVAILDAPLPEAKMQAIAAEIGYSETAFLYPDGDIWKIRYFAPEIEVPFCGHATIATGAQLGATFGAGTYRLELASGKQIPVQAEETEADWKSTFRSPPTWSKLMPDELLTELLTLFGLTKEELDPGLPPHIIHAGATHGFLALRTRERLSQLGYNFEQGRMIQEREDFATFHIVYAENKNLFHARDPFAVGGVYEDPATGAAAAAMGGFLRDIAWSDSGSFEIIQGEDIGKASRLIARYNDVSGEGVHIEGLVSKITSPLKVE